MLYSMMASLFFDLKYAYLPFKTVTESTPCLRFLVQKKTWSNCP
ncbi:hypothetical protein DSUL_50385 [Desulfovibrionales bacterium]